MGEFDLTKTYELIQEHALSAIGAIITLIIGFWIAGKVTKLVGKAMKKGKVDENVRPFLTSIVGVGIKILVLLTVAGMFGIETTSFIAIFSALAFAIGMALQGSLGHFASGVMILIFKPYKVGDLVELNGNIGHVREIQVFNTIIVTLDNRKIIMPNGTITGSVITNISALGEIRVDLTFGIGYDDDIDKARTVIEEVAKGCPQVLTTRPVDIFVSELADSSVNFAVRPWCDPADYWDVYFYMHEQIKKAFDKAGLNIPYPQMDVHVSK